METIPDTTRTGSIPGTESSDLRLSVVVVTVYNLNHLSECLSSLMKQPGIPDAEIIAVYDDRVNCPKQFRENFVSVIFHRVRGIQTQERMRAVGACLATGDIIALTVDHCIPDKHWCQRIVEAHAGPYAGVGGGFEIGTQPRTLINLAVHFYDYCNYGYFHSPVKRGPAKYLSDANVSYKREALLTVVDKWKESFHVPFVNEELLARGGTLWLSPDIVVYQNRDISFGRAMEVAYLRGRVFGSKRVSGASSVKKIFYIVSSALLPVLLLGRFTRNILFKRSQLAAIAKASPYIVLLSLIWSTGEFMGYISGRALIRPGETYD
jgi:hypothetical protein